MIPMTNERRKVVRYMTELDIDIVLQDGTILAVQIYDISLNGIQFKCDGLIANEIEPRGIQNYSLDHKTIKVIAKFPTNEKQKFYASCRIISARRLSQEEYMIGLEFFEFEKSSDKVLESYINKLALDALG